MRRTNTVIIGGGQAGLAMSRCLTDRAVEHVVLERARIAERWRSERWDSARLLTPNWMTRLPGFAYRGADPDGYMTMPEVVGFLRSYAESFSAPVHEGTSVTAVRREGQGYRIETDRGVWLAANVVIATGHCDKPRVPRMAGQLSDEILQLVPTRYRNPDQLPRGGVLVVGASASGLQLAHEIHRSGRSVTLAVGRHTRLPRVYRGRDILSWFDAAGILDERFDEVRDLDASRGQPSLQLVGHPDRRSLDLATLQDAGVRLVGRAVAAARDQFLLAQDLAESVAAAEAKLTRLLARIDDYIAGAGLAGEVPRATPRRRVSVGPAPTRLDLREAGIRTVLWATGFRRSYPWLQVPVLDARGEIRHRGGVTPAPGLYVLGLQMLRRRKSSFIDGVGPDAAELADHLIDRADRRRTAVA